MYQQKLKAIHDKLKNDQKELLMVEERQRKLKFEIKKAQFHLLPAFRCKASIFETIKDISIFQIDEICEIIFMYCIEFRLKFTDYFQNFSLKFDKMINVSHGFVMYPNQEYSLKGSLYRNGFYLHTIANYDTYLFDRELTSLEKHIIVREQYFDEL